MTAIGLELWLAMLVIAIISALASYLDFRKGRLFGHGFWVGVLGVIMVFTLFVLAMMSNRPVP